MDLQVRRDYTGAILFLRTDTASYTVSCVLTFLRFCNKEEDLNAQDIYCPGQSIDLWKTTTPNKFHIQKNAHIPMAD